VENPKEMVKNTTQSAYKIDLGRISGENANSKSNILEIDSLT